MVTIRIDVDYAYPSRLKSFIYTALDIKKAHKGYLKNSKIIAKMINESLIDVKAYWFFTPYTIPDQELLMLLKPERHEVALHVANNPEAELLQLEKRTGRKINYYTVHGTARLLARLMWRRKLRQARIDVPKGFPLKSFYVYPTIGLDVVCYGETFEEALEVAQEAIRDEKILHVHPEWLLQSGTINHRGSYYQVFKRILDVDGEFDRLFIAKKRLLKIASYSNALDYKEDVSSTEAFLGKLADRGVDVFTFIERSWYSKVNNVPKRAVKTEDNIALLQIDSYEDWWNKIGKKTRNMVRKAEKSGIITRPVKPSREFAEGVWKIYNETPIRQSRAFPHYGSTLQSVEAIIFNAKESTFIGSYFEGSLVGFIQLEYGDNIAIISQILSLQMHWDKAVNNALVAKVVEVCNEKKIKFVMYGRIGNHPSLDSFKESNLFRKYIFSRYYVPLTRKGRLAISLRLYKALKDTLPTWLKKPLFPLYNWISRQKVRGKLS